MLPQFVISSICSNGVTPLTFEIVRQLVVELSVRSDPLAPLKDVKFKHSPDAAILKINKKTKTNTVITQFE